MPLHTQKNPSDAPFIGQLKHATPSNSLHLSLSTEADIFAAFFNPTAGIYLAWLYSGSNLKSVAEVQRFANKYCSHPSFNTADTATLNITAETSHLDRYIRQVKNPFHSEHGWQELLVKICLPCTAKMWASEDNAPELEIHGVHHILSIIHGASEDTKIARTFYFTPSEQFWQPDHCNDSMECLYGEVFFSDPILEAHKEINSKPRAADDDLEHAVAALMVWSDSTRLTHFGTTSLWPFYLQFGNLSKYVHGKPMSHSCYHLAYIYPFSTCSLI